MTYHPPTTNCTLAPGTWRDYLALAAHHYRPGRPTGVARILTAVHHQPTVIGRYLGRPAERQVAGVLVETLPRLSCRMRDHATGDRYRRLTDPRQRSLVLNAELRCIARVIVHPQWRGLGLAVRLVRHALASAETPLTEAIAAMGAVNPFFERAGMTAYHCPHRPGDARLLDALRHVGIDRLTLASPADAPARLAALADRDRTFLDAELRRWHRQLVRHTPTSPPTLDELLAHARRKLLSSTVYFLKASRT